jgi:hypothetical protein
MADEETKPPIPLEEIRATALTVAGERDLASMSRRLGQVIHGWAAPSLVVCLRRDAGAEGGWRIIPELTSGQVSAGFERTFARQVDEAPAGALAQPLVVRPTEDLAAAGVKLRDNWIIPWSWGAAGGFIFLKGIARPYPPNLGDAVALASQPLWPLACERWELGERLSALADELRRSVERLAIEVPAATGEWGSSEAEDLRGQLAEARHKIDALERSRNQAETDRDRAEAESADLRDQVEALERRMEAEAVRGTQAAGLRERLEAAESARDEAQRERERARAEVETYLHRERERDAQLGVRLAEVDETRRQLQTLQDRLDAAEKARAVAETERERAKGEADNLWRSLDSLQREIQAERGRAASEKAALEEARKAVEARLASAEAARAAAERERDEARASAAQAVSTAEAQAKKLDERWRETESSFRAALDALRRTPFVPPALRVSISGVEGYFAGEAKPPASSRPVRVLILDRDTPTLDSLAAELEGAGIEVLIAHYPEEVGFFLKTPDSRRVTALVWDVMAFRAAGDLIDLARACRQDLSGAGLFLSFRAEQSAEAERAQLVPVSAIAGYLPRPLTRESVLEAFAKLPARSGDRR